MLPTDAFSPNYAAARERFRSVAAARGWRLDSYPVSAAGFADGDLTLDTARVGPAVAERLLILSSGLHGPEAPFGSAVQLAWLDALPAGWATPPGMAVLLLHALNPFGFANLRRVNEDNVDLNRNFLEPDDFPRLRDLTAREYGPLDPYLNPPRPPGPLDLFTLVFLRALVRFGRSRLTQVIPAGQYAFPKGIFFGGERRARSTEIIMGEVLHWVGTARLVVHLDFHTGLGPFGAYELLSSDAIGSERVKVAERLFGKGRIVHDHQTPGGYHNHGDMGEWLSRRFADRDYLYLCAEFGTYSGVRVIGTLRRENQAHHWSGHDEPLFKTIKSQMAETFTPRSPAWRWTVVQKSLNLIRTALNVCANPNRGS
jgi:hypothetical protein